VPSRGPIPARWIRNWSPDLRSCSSAAPPNHKPYGTPLDLARRSQDIRYLVIVGVVTEISMNGKLHSAAYRGYRVPSVTHGVASP
jgi:hypothetical protein